MLFKLKKFGSVLLVAGAMMGINGCAVPASPGHDIIMAGSKADDASEQAQYLVDMAIANRVWPDAINATQPKNLMKIRVLLGEGQPTIVAPTHMFGADVIVIPYDDTDVGEDADGNRVGRGDAVLANYFAPGEFGIAVKHHRPQYRTLDMANVDAHGMKEHFKLQDTHIEIVVGVADRAGEQGVVTLNNPQTYPDSSNPGRFGNDSYPMIFLKPAFPDYLTGDEHGLDLIAAFNNNMRSMALGFNAVSDFPGDYNGGDPLAARSPEEVTEHVAQMVRAIAGDEEARAWFKQDENKVYCAELAFLSMSAGMIVPLNAETVTPLVGADTWALFDAEVKKHQAGDPSAFTSLNGNAQADNVAFEYAPATLGSAASYDPEAASADLLAFRPMTMADIVQQFMATHFPRNIPDYGGEAIGVAQASALVAMQSGLLETMTLNNQTLGEAGMTLDLQRDVAPTAEEEAYRLATISRDGEGEPLDEYDTGFYPLTYWLRSTPLDERAQQIANINPEYNDQQKHLMGARIKVELLYSEIVKIVAQNHGSYRQFQFRLEPLMERAVALTGPRSADSGKGLFVPPSLMHIVAQDRPGNNYDGLLGLDYVGHGFHWSMVRADETNTEEPPVTSELLDPVKHVLEQAAGEGDEPRWETTFELPEGAIGATVTLTGGQSAGGTPGLIQGDPDLYLRAQRFADADLVTPVRIDPDYDATYDSRSWNPAGHAESAEVFYQAGHEDQRKIYVLVNGYRQAGSTEAITHAFVASATPIFPEGPSSEGE